MTWVIGWMRRGVIVCAAFVCGTHATIAQTPDASALIAKAQDAYRSGPFAERIQIEVIDGAGRREDSSIVLRVEPEGGSVRSMLLELPTMRIWSGSDRLIVVSTRDIGSWWGMSDASVGAAARLERALPPVVAPALAIVMGERGWTPVTPDIQWNGVSEDPGSGGWVVAGISGEFAVQATFDRASSRLVRLAISGPSGGPIARLSIACERLDAGSPDSWEPATDGFERREALEGLLERRPTLLAGDQFPGVGWVRSDGSSWRLGDAFDASSGADSPRAAVVVLFRASREASVRGETLRDVRSGVEAVRVVMRERLRDHVVAGERGTGAGVLLIPAAVFGGDGFDAATFEAITGEIGDLAPESPGLVWTMPERRTIDAVAPGAACVICVLDQGGFVRRVIQLDHADEREATVRKEIAAAISEALGEG